MNLVVDAGNTFIKVGVFDSDNLIKFFKWEYQNDIQLYLEEIKRSFTIKNVIYSSVVHLDLLNVFRLFFSDIIVVSSNSVFPFKIEYNTPETVGVDRLIGLTSAYYLSLEKPFLVIDIGTCITYDYVNKNNEYEGGGISPGISLRFKSMHQFTSKLPLVSYLNEPPSLIGDSTVNCLKSGVWYGILGEINFIIQRYQENNVDLQVFLTGGDTFLFVDDIKSKIFARPNLLLEGLNRLIHINAK